MSRQKMLAGATVGLGGLMGAIIAVPVTVAVLAPVVRDDQGVRDRHRPDDALPEGRPGRDPVARRDVREPARRHHGPRRGASSTCATTATTSSPPSPTPACTSAAPCRPTRPGFACPCHGGQYDSQGRRIAGPPVRPLNRYETTVNDKGHLILGQLYAMDDSLNRHQLKGPGPAGQRPALVPLSRRPAGLGASADASHTPDRQGTGRRCAARVGRGALRLRRPGRVVPVPQGARRHVLAADARLVAPDGLPAAGDDGRDPRDELPPRSRPRPTSRSATSRIRRRSAGSCAACTSGARR